MLPVIGIPQEQWQEFRDKVDQSLSKFVTDSQFNATEPFYMGNQAHFEALQEIVTNFLDDEGMGALFWPDAQMDENSNESRKYSKDHVK